MILMVVLFQALMGCQKAVDSPPKPSAPPQMKVGDEVSIHDVWRWMQQGSIFCYNEDPSDQTCTHVEFPSGLGPNEGFITQVSLAGDGSKNEKVTAVQKLSLKAAGLCTTYTEDFIDSHQYYHASDNIAKIQESDRRVRADAVQAHIAEAKRASKQFLGRESCFRFIATKVSPDGKVTEMEEHHYVGGTRQARAKENKITFFTAQSTPVLRTR
jgi:hypothetical protein